MAEDYLVQSGDCLTNIAFAHGFFWETLWNHGDNAELKQQRKDPNVLMEGDRLHLPDLTVKEESGATEQRHRFKLKGVPAKLKIRLLKDGKPRANESYKLVIDGRPGQGQTDGDGYLEQPLPPNAAQGELIVGEGSQKDIFKLAFGQVDPLDTDAGAAGRLHDLGYHVQEDLTEGIRGFQTDNGLEATGAMDDATRTKLQEKFGQ